MTPGHLGVVCHRGENSAIVLFSRRGHPLGEVALPLRLVRLQTTGNPYQLIALEPDLGPLLLQIKLKPFSLHRLGLPGHSRMPKQLTPAPWGYLLGDRNGRIDYLDPTGQRFKTLTWSKPITEIAPLGRDQLMIASPSAQGFGLYQVSS
ncbi:MAG: hypothetical protein HC860_19730 [Alkalinema sp. RU_4_3]|nr:hypothetical protein [Alkalinema sp. RU_4_3]